MPGMNPTLSEIRQKCQTVHQGDVTVAIVRVFSVYISWVAIRLGLTGNHISVFNIFLSTLLWLMVYLGGLFYLVAIFILIFGLILDSVDGEVARYRDEASLTGLFLDRMNSLFLYTGPFFFMLLGLMTAENYLLLSMIGFFSCFGMIGIRLTKAYVEASIVDGLMAEKTAHHHSRSSSSGSFIETQKVVRNLNNIALWIIDLILVRQVGIASLLFIAIGGQFLFQSNDFLLSSPIFWVCLLYAILSPGAVIYGIYTFSKTRIVESNYNAIRVKLNTGLGSK